MAASTAKDEVAFVVVPGSFATPALYEDNIVAGLRSRGYRVDLIGLLSANDGSRLPAPTMEDDAAHIRAAALAILDDPEQPRDVVLSVHSYSGIPGSSALKGLAKAERSAQQGKPATGVVGIVYLGSFVPFEGQSIRDIMGEAMPEAYRIGSPGGYLPGVSKELAPLIFNDLPPERALEILNAMTLHSSDSYSGKASYEAWRDIPSRQLIPEQDLIVPVPVQLQMYDKAAAAGGKITKVVVPGAGHALNVSKTELVVQELVKAAEASRSWM
ncbi:Alpha/beta hydrolase fold-1 [Microdochium trichocladiopsis]|uniref:Alpha/beta hydrolase fold-1 n=1 Tax=Microdochium trichocladiopsis TaxID=1682393 RepID=A0A9P8YGQ1_9PEZI|nr:Alpha/beta hydrolase fold-1 [Microdochium trichocladiopsis]KAH7037785.1 Alpha/beta hydrolase fold-1 [Microdochium trichocladiopsis]